MSNFYTLTFYYFGIISKDFLKFFNYKGILLEYLLSDAALENKSTNDFFYLHGWPYVLLPYYNLELELYLEVKLNLLELNLLWVLKVGEVLRNNLFY